MAERVKEDSLPTAPCIDAAALYNLIQQLELAANELKSGIFNERLIRGLLKGLKEYGPRFEQIAIGAVQNSFMVFKAAMENESFSISNRFKLFELLMLRRNNWRDHHEGSLFDAYKMLKSETQGTQTPTNATEAATNTEVASVGKQHTKSLPWSINGVQQTTYDHYVEGAGVQIKVSGTSARLVGDVKGMLDDFYKGPLFHEACKENASALQALRPAPPVSLMDEAAAEKQEVGPQPTTKN